MKYLFLSAAVLLLWQSPSHANCEKINDTCSVDIADLRPAQFSVGFRQIQTATLELKAMSAKKLQREIAKKPALVILGPQSTYFVVDRNHFALELLNLGIRSMQAEVIDDGSNLSWPDFWSYVEQRKEVYLYDEHGNGPLDPELLPKNMSDLKDDPYRSLSVEVRDQGGYDKTSILFAEFQWAQFFRTRISVGTTDADFANALSQAMVLCHSSEASALPGAKVP